MVFLTHLLTVGDDMIRNEELIDPTPLLTHLLLRYYNFRLDQKRSSER